jgi:hypothetical protein
MAANQTYGSFEPRSEILKEDTPNLEDYDARIPLLEQSPFLEVPDSLKPVFPF